MSRAISRLALAGLMLALPVSAQEASTSPTASARVPFGVGERLEYEVRFGKIRVGSGDMEVIALDTVRGHDVWHTEFHMSGGIPFFHVNDHYDSWLDTRTLASLRYWQDIDEGNYDPKRHYEIYPDRLEYIEHDKNGDRPPQASVAHPLDDGSFVYYLRTLPLRVGMDTTFSDYFMADRNPVRFKVLRRDTIEVPAGRFPSIVVQPIFRSKLFSEGGNAEIWLSDDASHIMLQMKSKLSFGSLNLYLKSYHPAPTTSSPLNREPPTPTQG